jgi:5-methyltetrahydrofolate--homocysteine methyltransferase
MVRSKAVIGIYAANTVNDDDIEVYDEKGNKLQHYHSFVSKVKNQRVNTMSLLSDFIAPKTDVKRSRE